MVWTAVDDDEWTYFTYSHGGNDNDDDLYDSAQDAFDNGESYANWHRKRWGYRHKITVKKHVISEMIEIPEDQMKVVIQVSADGSTWNDVAEVEKEDADRFIDQKGRLQLEYRIKP